MSAALKTWSIPGGIHPPENKSQSLTAPIKKAPLPNQIILPLSMHIGAPAKAIVAVGDKVLKGQVVAQAKGFVSASVHASTSGTVIAIEPRPIIHASGMSAPCIVIESDGNDEWTERQPLPNYTQLDKAKVLDHIREAGIAGMGGAGFPSAVKLATDKTVEQLIINGTECEPYITADDILMREKADEIVKGIQILQYVLSPKQTLIGVEDNKPDAIKALQLAVQGTDIHVVVFPTKYPSGGEKQLIKILTGKEVKAGGLPADVGVVCQNVGTTQAIYKAVILGEPLISRVTTVTGNAVDAQQNYDVLLGTAVSELLTLCGYDSQRAERVISGGPMMGFTMESIDVPIVKTTNCILAPDKQELPAPPPAQPCIRCGICAEACPVSLLPQQMYWFSQAKDQVGLTKHHLMDCIECGACSYVCPSNIPLVQYFRASKADIRQTEADHKKAEYAKERFEARQDRLEKAEAEKEAKRKARQEKANKKPASNKDQDAIQAALARTKKTAPTPPPTETATDSAIDDPVAAAIARAKAKAAGDTPEPSAEEKAKAAITSLEKRLEKAEAKLEAAKTSQDENLPAFEASVDKLKAKLDEAKKSVPVSQPAPTEAPVDDNDPVAAAIAKAKAKRGSGEELSEEDKLKQDIEKLTKRVNVTQQKYDQAVADNADNVDIFKSSLEKMQDKLRKAEQALAALTPAVTKSDSPEHDPDDPVQAAILRAKAKRQSAQALSPEARLQKDIASFQKRIQTTAQKLEQARAEGNDKVEILEGTLVKLNDKLSQAQNELQAL